MRKGIAHILLIALGLMFSSNLTFGAPGSAVNKITFNNLTEDVGRGFGSTWNRYAWSMGMDEYLYVGTWNNQTNWPLLISSIISGDLTFDFASGTNPLPGIALVASEGGEVWRYDGGQDWMRVAKAPSEVTGFRKMINFQGSLYAGTASSELGADLWKKTEDASSPTGETWGPIDWGEKDINNNSIRALAVIPVSIAGKELLYVGTENNVTGAELWTYDGAEWSKINASFDGAHSVAEIIVFEDTHGAKKIYVGTWQFEFDFSGETATDTFKLFVSEDGSEFNDVTPQFSGREDLNNVGVMTLVEYGGRLYLGTVNYIDGFTLLSSENPSDPASWSVLTMDGFGNSDNAYFWCAAVVDDKLFAGIFNSGVTGGASPILPMDGDGQVLYTDDGVNFKTLLDDGFGEPYTYGIRTMLADDNKLFLGTATNVLIPDFQSSLYETMGFGDLIALLLTIDLPVDEYLIPLLMEGFAQYNSGGEDAPFIGTQVWASSFSKQQGNKTK